MKEYLHIMLACAVVALVIGWTAGFTANSPDKPRRAVALADWRE